MGPASFDLFDAVGAVVVVLDRVGRIAHWNRAASELTGYAFEEVKGRALWDVVLRDDDVDAVKTVFRNLKVSALPREFENMWVTKSGEARWLAWSNTVTTDAAGQVEYVIATGVDRTDARRAEEERRASEAKLDAIVSIAADAIISIDERQRIVLFNRGAEEIFGWAAEEILGESLALLLPERLAAAHAAHVEAFAREADGARRMAERVPEIVGRRKSGEEFPAEAAISKVYIEGAWVFTVILRDISDRKLVERSLRDAIQSRDTLLGAVAHDLRNPLSAIGLQAVRLARATGRGGDDPHPAVSRIQEEAARMTRLIDDLLDYSRLETGQLSLTFCEIDLRELAAAALQSARPVAQASGLEIRDAVPAELPRVRGDPDRLRQVFDNLLGNAVKFSREGGVVEVTAEARSGRVAFSVVDAGPGIPADVSRLFEPFWQGERGDRRGAGLGLTICKQVVEAHGGAIDAEGSDQGSRFTFTIPERPPEAEPSAR